MVKASNTFYIILGTLNLGPKSGYDIKKSIERSTGEFFSINYGQIYPMLKIMVEEGYAALIQEDSSGRPDRKVYKLIKKGEEEFLEWLSYPVNYNNSKGNELLVKLFFGRFLPVEENIRRLKEFRKVLMGHLHNINLTKEFVDERYAGNAQYDYSMIAVRHGQIMIQMKLDWCNESLERLNEQLME
jgi:DNA-binding PadR family transcriptional regulator